MDFELRCPVELGDGFAAEIEGQATLEDSPPSVIPEQGSPTPVLPEDLVFVCADDDMVGRMIAENTLEKVKANQMLSIVLGKTFGEVAGLVRAVEQMAAGLGHERLVVQLDQYMEYDEGTVLGTDLCRQLRKQAKFNGVVVIVSANDDADSMADYIDAGADLGSGKTLESLKVLPGKLARAYDKRFGPDAKPSENSRACPGWIERGS